MKRRLHFSLFLFTAFLFNRISPLSAQTTMAPGDMAVLGLNCTHDAVSWVTLVDICPCTVFYFSDDPYRNANGFCTSAEEHCIKFTVTTLIPAGTIMTYDDSQAYPTVGAVTFSPNNGAVTAAYSNIATAGTNPGFNNNGDNALFFQGSFTAPNFICGLINSGNWTASGAVTCSNRNDCELPAALTNGINALWTNQCMGAVYNCTVTSGSASVLAAAINNSANWTCNPNTELTVPPPCNFSVSSPRPCFSCQINDTVCPGQSTTLLAQGSGTNFKWYNALTGGSPLYTGDPYTTPVLNSATTYYVTQTTGGVESTPRVPVSVTTLPKPNAGPDKSAACIILPGGSVNMAASGAGTWTARTGNPGTETIGNTTSATSAITNFTVAGTYGFVWTNSNGCTDTAEVVISQAANASISAPAQLSCTVTSVTLTATSSTIGATYSWTGGNTSSSLNVSTANTYAVTVTNPAGGCTATASATVNSIGGAININAAPTASTCGNNNGSATVTIASGTGPYTYSWSNNSTTQTINNLSPNSYTVTVSGQGGCSATASANVTITGGLNVIASSSITTCGLANGTAGVTVTGTGPFTYSWSNGNTVASLTNLNAGTYNVTVSGGGCSATASALVDTSSAITVNTFSGRAGCTNSGTATVNVNKGTGPFTYLWSNGGTTASINSLSAGPYTVTVTGAGGCSASATATVISTGTGVTLITSSTPSTCSGNTGSASVTTTTGDSPFTYLWSNGGTAATINNISAASYTVTVTAVSGCSATAAVDVTATGSLNLTISATPTICGTSTGTASVSAGNYYTYSWSNGATTDTINNLPAATYTVTVLGNAGCTGTASAVVNSSTGAVNIQAQPNPLCQGDTSQICAPAGFLSYHWNTGSTSSCIFVEQPGNYYATVIANGCTDTSNRVNVMVHQPIPVDLTENGDTLHAHGPFGFQWYFNNAVLAGDTAPVLIAGQPGNYYVIQTDTNGCVETSAVQNIKGVTGTEQLSSDDAMMVYPNPLANGGWHLDVSELWLGGWCDIYDAAGRLVYRVQITNQKSEISLIVASGIYFMHLNSPNHFTVRKLVKL